MNKTNRKHIFVILSILTYLFSPLLATLLYSMATQWQVTILPEGFSLHWYSNLFTDSRFLAALGRSFLVTGLSTLVSIVVMVPTVFIATVYFPKLDKLLNLLIMIPFAIQGVVLAVGLMKLYSGGLLPISGTIWILVGAYFVTALPFIYQGVKNSLKTIEVTTLLEVAQMLHATNVQAFFYVILPNMMKGIIVALLLSFSFLFGEFVLANILAGGNYETVQVYLYNMRAQSGHFTSAIVITYFSFILIFSGLMLKVNRLFNK
ncbi:ABC transporter permease [Desulfotomaculum nigrificans]|uniref:ABC transporter permease n=1 Tax=Desulfotomaculum nigrificans TaxID=1565 RepID=UPI0001FAE821|nr:ABC transporter permease subunit [Desulfotomaculum nigrificans]